MPDLALDLASNFQDNIYWEPDCPPESGLLAESDEFNGSVLNPKWLTWNPGGGAVAQVTSVGVANGQAELTMSSGTTGAGGIYQPLPVGQTAFTFAGKFTAACVLAATGGRYGLMIGQDLTAGPTTADTRSAGMLYIDGATSGVACGLLTAYNVAFTENQNYSRRDSSIYVRGRVTALDTVPVITWDWSDDGNGWQQMDTRAIGFTPVHFGMWMRNQQTVAANMRLRCEWFRVMAGDVGLTTLAPGGRLIPFT